MRFFIRLFLGVVLTSSAASQAQDQKIEQAIKHRKAAFTLMATYVNRMVQTVEGNRPFDAKQMAQDAKVMESISKLPWEGFVDGSERGDTRAKDDIWLEEEKFKQYANDLQSKTSAVSVAAQSGDIERFKLAVGQMRGVCNACHKAFRKE